MEDVKEIAQNTADDIDAHFGKQDEAEEAVTEGLTEAVTESD